MRFRDKVVIVTGGGSGIGEVMVRMFAAEGASVAVADWHGEVAKETAASVVEAGGQAVPVTVDVSDEADTQRMVTETIAAFGKVDVLVNNAAVCEGDDVLAIDAATWDHDVSVVLKGPFLCTRAVLEHMVSGGGGVIVNIASVNGLAYFGNEAYSAAKAGVINFTQSVATRYGRHQIRANAIAPGSIRTPIWQERVDRDPRVFERLVKWYPLGRVGEPEDVAKAALFLASDDAAWITGSVLRVDGGLLAGNDVMARELLAMEPQED